MRKLLPLAAIAGSLMLALTSCSGGSTTATPQSSGQETIQETVHMNADYPSYGSPLAAAAKSDLVVVGVPVKSWDDMIYPDRVDSDDPIKNPQAGLSEKEINEFIADSGVPITVTEFEVTEVVSGEANVGDRILVDQLGGASGGVTYDEENTTNMRNFSASTLRSDKTRIMLSLGENHSGRRELVNPEEGFNFVSTTGEIDTVDGKSIGKTIKSFKKSLNKGNN